MSDSQSAAPPQNPRTIEQVAEGRRRQLGRNIERLMEVHRMSYRKFAKMAGLSTTGLYSIVDGKVDAKVSSLWPIADFFGLSLDALFAEDIR